jgi:RimJ/RimL family protein N-acetyltransferase
MIITIRQWREDDLQKLVLYANNINVWNNLRNYFPSPYTDEDAKDWLTKMATSRPIVNLAIDVDGEAVGGIGLILNSDVYIYSAEIGYWIGEPFWNKGIGTEAIRQMIEYCYYYFDIVRIYAEVFETNKASMRALEKNGFYLEGVRRKAVFKNSVLMDDYIWVKLRPW